MADTKITALTELAATPDGGDILAIIDDPAGSATSKKITVTNLMAAQTPINTFARVVKKADETITSSTTLHDDNELKFTPNINKTYGYSMMILLDSHATPDFKHGWTLPTGCTGIRNNAFWNGADDGSQTDVTTSKNFQTGGLGITEQTGLFIMSSTAGTIQYQWAQNTSDANDTIVKEGSFLVVWEETP